MRNVLIKQKRNIHMAAWLLLVFLAAIVLILACRGSNQAAMSFLLPYHLQGEYRLGEGSWAELQEDTDLSALQGDLYLRGNFDREIPEGMLLNFYLDHIAMSMFVNGEFLTAVYACDTNRLEELVGRYSRPYWIAGFFTIVVSVLLLGMAFGFRMRHIPQHNLLFHMGLFSFFTGGYILLDTPEISLNFVYWRPGGLLVKNVFFILMIFNLVKAVIIVSKNYQYSMKVKQMEEELKNSRIVLAMSQIRSHFMFNVLNAISSLCKYDPEKADEMVVCFARYLRVNIDVLREDRPVPFRKILEQLEDYVKLEQLRFEDKLQFVKKIEADDFELPYLTIQPIIENSIKHGLLPKEEGGTIELHTKREGENILISVTDNGIGYNMEEIDREHSVGLENVRFRLKYMMHASMTSQSTPGVGTKVTIIIPDDNQRRDRA